MNTEQTRSTPYLALPAWWIKAYEASALSESSDDGAMLQALASGLTPALSPFELNALAMLVGDMQRQILSSSGTGVTIDVTEHLKHAGTAAKTRRLQFAKTAQILAGLRLLGSPLDAELSVSSGRGNVPSAFPPAKAASNLLPEVPKRAAGALGLGTATSPMLPLYAPFAADSWLPTANGKSARLQLTLAPLGPELLLGLSDAHIDLWRAARGETAATPWLGAQGPLTLARSAWLELGSPEQLLLLRLERSMQWEFRLLQLEGIFGMPLATLFSGIKLPSSRAGSATELNTDSRYQSSGKAKSKTKEADLAGQLRLLARLGKRLIAQGLLAPSVANQYLALDTEFMGDHTSAAGKPLAAAPKASGLNLVWQAAPGNLIGAASQSYRREVAGWMLAQRYPRAISGLAQVCLGVEMKINAVSDAGGNDSRDPICRATALWERLEKHLSNVPVTLTGLECQPSQPLSPVALFFEFALRQERQSRWPLPATLAASQLAELTRVDAQTPDLGARLANFCQLIDDDVEFPRELQAMPMATLVSAASRSNKEFHDWVQGVLVRPRAPLTLGSNKPGVGSTPMLASLDVGAGEASVDDTVASSNVGRKSGGMSSTLAARMLKIAATELGAMRRGDPDLYRALKRSYLESLDESGRRLMLDVQKRIQPTLFEEQLRQRLVRYMVDHPGAWRSADAARSTSP